jgi:DNA adenine methylase
MRPFLKWAGNKYRIVDKVVSMLPEGSRLVEPFCGSGAVFLNTDFESYLLADVNPDLISLYMILQVEGQSFIDYAKTFFIPENNHPEAYYEFRETFNHTKDAYEKSALFIYLNRHGYNGLCRYNGSGRFNVPFGRYHKPYFPEAEMQYFSDKSRKAQFVCGHFTQAMDTAVEGDVVYCDPPYVPLTVTANFTTYSKHGFGLNEQMDLALKAQELADRGVPVLISNHCNEFTQNVYSASKIRTFDVQRLISCDGSGRGKAPELLALFD